MSTVNFTDNHLMRSMCESDEEKNRLENCVTESQRKQRMNELGNRDMRSLILRLEEDKKRLTQRIEKLTANEKTLVLELERIKRHDGTGLGSTKAKSAARLEEHLSGVEADRDYWRSQVELLQQMLANPALNQRNGMVTRSAGSRLRAKPPLTGQGTIKPISKSRDGIQSKQSEDLNQLTKLRQEKEDMKMMLNKLEQRVQEIQKNVHSLTVERDQLNKLYKEARAEVHRLHQDLYAIRENGDRANYNSQSALRRAETERDRVLVDLSRVTAERDGLVTKYKNTSENAVADKQRLTKQMDQLEKNLEQICTERDELTRRLGELRQHLKEQHDRQKQLEGGMIERQELYKQEKATNDKLQDRLDAVICEKETAERKGQWYEHQFKEAQSSLSQTEQQLSKERERNNWLSEMHEKLTEDTKTLRADLEVVKKDKAHLELCMEDLTVNHRQAVRERDELVQCSASMREHIRNLESNLKEAESEQKRINETVKLEKSANDKLQERLDAVTRDKESAERRGNWYEGQFRASQDTLSHMEQELSAEKERSKWLLDRQEKSAEEANSLRATVDLANKDKAHLEACIEDLTASHRQVVRERDELVQRSSALREHMMDLESTLKDVESELKRTNEMIRAERNNNSDLQQQLDQSRRRGELVEKDLANMNAKFRECEDQLHASGTRVSQLERELRAERDDYAQLRARMEALDDEKQGLESALRETTQRLSHSEVDLSSRTRELNELRTSNEESTRAFNRAQDTLSLKTSELANTRTELNAVQSNLIEVRRLLEAEEKENTRIREEFTQLSREFQTLQTNFQDAQDEQEELKQRAKGYLSEISRLERVVSERDGECVQLMDQLRAANADCESWRSRWESSEKKLTTVRIEAEDRESELVSERERADAREREVAHLKTSLNTAELQSSAMSRTAAETTEQLQMTRAELEILSSEITRLREISTRLESEKASAQRETNAQRTEIEQLRSQLDDFELELEQLREQLDQERSMNNNLQSAMQSTRQKEQNAILELQEKLVEVNALKERLNAVEERADASYRESERLRERLAEAEREANRLSRSLSAEKFEKERALTELRLNTGYRPSGYSSYGTGLYPSSTLLRERQPYSEREKDY
ncbi:unnamed protein product [Dicrocoelium dendriticum]|nr:unnamed protein product [Dicrocoelium dendriticum]